MCQVLLFCNLKVWLLANLHVVSWGIMLLKATKKPLLSYDHNLKKCSLYSDKTSGGKMHDRYVLCFFLHIALKMQFSISDKNVLYWQ